MMDLIAASFLTGLGALATVSICKDVLKALGHFAIVQPYEHHELDMETSR
jgi:hypothetical protein